jgi:1,4-alpha-glucan branching enzyme
MTEPFGTFCLVLHSHLPWLAHAGAWPVGEEWLHQAWSGSYRRLVRELETLAAEGARDLLTLGITPVLAAQLDDPYCLGELHGWLGCWQNRAQELAGRRAATHRALAEYEFREAADALGDFEARWRHGGSAVLRPLVDAGVVEVLGGPATHSFTPLLTERLAAFALQVGLTDARLRLGCAPAGIWAPECGYRPGLQRHYAEAGVTHFVVDGPSLHGNTAEARTIAGSDVVVFGRDLDVTYRVWSPRRGYPGGRHYRDFHTFDHATGFRTARVTSGSTPPEQKAPYDPAAGRAAAQADAEDFVAVVRARLLGLREQRGGRPGLVVAAYDTELFGHWWHEGPKFLTSVLRALPAAGVRVATLRGALAAGHLGADIELPESSWGSGKDWRVWQVPDLVEQAWTVQDRLLRIVDKVVDPGTPRFAELDQLAREALLTLSSDWAFMVTKNSAPGYARRRAADHAARFAQLAEGIEAGWPDRGLSAALREIDGPFGHLDARQLARAIPG